MVIALLRFCWPRQASSTALDLGDRGGGDIALAIVICAVLMAPVALAVRHGVDDLPALSDISTDLGDPPPLDAAAAPRSGHESGGADLGGARCNAGRRPIRRSPGGATSAVRADRRGSGRPDEASRLGNRLPAADRRRDGIHLEALARTPDPGVSRSTWRSASPTRATPPMSTCARRRATAATISATTPPASPISCRARRCGAQAAALRRRAGAARRRRRCRPNRRSPTRLADGGCAGRNDALPGCCVGSRRSTDRRPPPTRPRATRSSRCASTERPAAPCSRGSVSR